MWLYPGLISLLSIGMVLSVIGQGNTNMFNNVTFFEWIGFFFGGAVGSLIILGAQMLVTSISAKRKYKDEKAHVTHALLEELKICLAQCDYMVEKINLIPNGAYTFPRFNYAWLDV